MINQEFGLTYCYSTGCPSGKPVYDENRVCRERCGIANALYWTGTKCERSCPADKPVSYDYLCGTCDELTPKYPVLNPLTDSCRSCTEADGGLFWDNGACVARCPEDRPVIVALVSCRESCPFDNYWDPSAKECFDRCPSGREAADDGKICKSCKEVATAQDNKIYYERGSGCVA